ncbi:hypothetical protein C6496_11790 [Candidatus Poribacteria bacterium]|nr:MAG: hypothetical protein C6496_11790 [Candidatus Poribacteria bacterium]
MGNECRIRLLCTRIKQKGERITNCAFVSDVMLVILLQRGIIVSDSLMIGFEIQLWHVGMIASFGRSVNGKFRGIYGKPEKQIDICPAPGRVFAGVFLQGFLTSPV